MSEAFLSSVGSRQGHFKLESGHHSDFWLDLETLCLRPANTQPFAVELAARLRPHGVQTVCGPLNEGAFVALMVASELACEFTYAERFVNPKREALFPVEYRLPVALQPMVRGKRVAIVNDVISAGSAVRGAFVSLQAIGARVVAIASLLVLGTALSTFARDKDVAIEALVKRPHNLWIPDDCPLCRSGLPLDAVDQ